MPITSEARYCSGTGAALAGSGSALLPASPFYAPRYHFGMLLGVDDFETEQAYHRGKGRLHNAWLHRDGVVWGFGVDAPDRDDAPGTLRGELRVHPGFALDAAGRELHLDALACMGVAAWYQAHRDEPEVRDAVDAGSRDPDAAEDPAGSVRFTAHVRACFRACLTRQVPAISEPCNGTGGDVAYSRTHETVDLHLVPGPAPQPVRPYHRLRLLFALEGPAVDGDGNTLPADQEVIAARGDILALPAQQQPAAYLAAFRRFAALDEIDLRPAATPEGEGSTLFPANEDTCVPLAQVRILLSPGADGALALAEAAVDVTVRPSHVATSTIQELLCGPLFRAAAAAPPPAEDTPQGDPIPLPPADAGGPRIDPASVRLEGEAVTMTATSRLSRASVAARGFSVSAYDNRDGWHVVEIREATVDRGGTRIRLELNTGFGGNLVRIIARGTGPTPLLGTNGVPLAGAPGGPPGNTEDGVDFVLMLKRSET